MHISYYLLREDKSDELKIFKELQTICFAHNQLTHANLELSLFSLTKSVKPFLNDPTILAKLKAEDLDCLPLVKVNDILLKKGSLLSAEELSQLTTIGLSIQKTP